MRERGSILVGLLWCVVLLVLVVVGALHTATMDLRVTKNYGDRIQAHYLALAGIEKARALLHQASRNHRLNGGSGQSDLLNAPNQFRDIAFGRGQFRVFHHATDDEGGGIIYGVSDEASRLNVNTATADQLTKLDGLSGEIAAAILTWRGVGAQANAGGTNASGANAEYYASLQPPYQPRNGAIQTVRELLMIRGVTSDLLFGKDTQQNGFLPDVEEDRENPSSANDLGSDADGGWAPFLTVTSSVANVNANGQNRVDVQTADENALTAIHGITAAIAGAIVSYRNQNRFQSIADLLDVTPPNPQGGQVNQGSQSDQSGQTASPNSSDPNSSYASGQPVIDETLLMDIADDVTVAADKDQAGLINLNTASLQTLLCLPGMDRERAQAIISFAHSKGGLPNIAWLIRVPGMDRQLFKQIAPYVTTRSETYRILGEGRIKSTGASQRIQVTVQVSDSEVTTLCYREDSL